METQGSPNETAVSPSAHPGEGCLQSWGAGTSRASGWRCSSPPVQGPSRVPPPSQSPGRQLIRHRSPEAGGKQKEVCLVLSTRWLSFQKEFPRVHSFLSFPVAPEAAPPNYTCLLQAALPQGLSKNGSDLVSPQKTTSPPAYQFLEATAPSFACLTWLLQTHPLPPRPALPHL